MTIDSQKANGAALPLVSVVVPVYNAAPYLRQCVESLLSQTLTEFEIILVDDGSKDGGGEMCDEFAKARKNIKSIRQPNAGPSAARNAGLAAARGKLIAFVDSDDSADPRYLERLAEAIADNDVAVCGARDVYEGKSGHESDRVLYPGGLRENREAPFFAAESAGLFNPLWNKLYRAEIIGKNKISFHGYPAEDFDFNIAYFHFADSIAIVDEPLYFYHHRGGECLTAKYCRDMYPKILECNEKRAGIFRRFDEKYGTDHAELLDLLCADYLWLCVANAFRADSPETPKDRYKLVKSVMTDPQNAGYLTRFTPKTRYQSLFKAMCRTKSPLLVFLAYRLLFFLRNRFGGTYAALRNGYLRRKSRKGAGLNA